MSIRSPICSVLGHVDHGKSSILDYIRDSSIVAGEAGAITQAIGASIVPLDVIKRKCKGLLEKISIKFTIPGLLFIDTPGHAAFTSLRKRGGALADIAILVVDINEGFKPQTKEAVEILKHSKTPFIVAANKIDLIPGWHNTDDVSILSEINRQNPGTMGKVETKMYELVGKLSELGFNSERFDRVEDYTKQIAIVPCSAKTGEGLPELLMVLAGLAQRFLEQCLHCNVEGFARGTILEVKETVGLGKTADIILFDGTLRQGDTVVIGGIDKPIVTKIKALLQPASLAEMRDKKTKFASVKEAVAATGVKISAPDLDNVISGMPLMSASPSTLESAKEEVQRQIDNIMIETDSEGIIIKADTLGSLEAMITMLREKNIPIRKALVGDINKKDITDAESNHERDPLLSAVLAFNVKILPEAEGKSANVKIIKSDVIYRLLEEYEKWKIDETKRQESKELDKIVRPCKLQLMPNYLFRQSNPAVIGTEVLAGKVKTGMPLMNKEGKVLTEVKALQQEKESISEADQGKQIAMSMDDVIIGRQLMANETLYSAIPEEDFRKLKGLKKYLTKQEIEVIKEIAEIMRKNNPVWGV